MFNRIIIAATAALFLLAGAVTYAHSAECGFSLSEKIAENKEEPNTHNVQSHLLSVEQKKAVMDAIGVPPVEEPFDMTIMGATVRDTNLVMFFVHRGDCGFMGSRPMPAEMFIEILGRQARI